MAHKYCECSNGTPVAGEYRPYVMSLGTTFTPYTHDTF